MSDIPLRDLVEDWGGFEKLVAKLHDTGTVEVKHDVTLVGKFGTPRQIDVVVKHREGLYEHLIIVECKYWNQNVSRLHVDALITAVEDLNASRGVIFSAKGFQEGAIAAAKHSGVDLYKVREPKDSEWGLPGRIVDFYMQFFQLSVGNMEFHSTAATGIPITPVRLDLILSEGEDLSKTPTVHKDGSQGRTIEELLISAASEGAKEFTKNTFLLCGGADCTRYMLGHVNVEPPAPYLVPQKDIIVVIPKVTFDLAIKIQQSRFTHDRAAGLMFALAVEDCIKGGVFGATRANNDSSTVLSLLSAAEASKTGDVFKNGSVMKVMLKGFFPFEEIANLQPVAVELVRKPLGETE